MKRIVLVLSLLLLASTFAPGQDGAGASSEGVPLDAVSKKAADLEAQLNKVLDHSPEGAAAMLELIDLYHEHGRVFGLVRTGQRFVNAQPIHPKHEHVMLAFLDGLAATSRSKELVGTSRQFLTRYPKSKASVRVEEDLARLLQRTGSRQQAAQAHERVWKRQGPNARHAAAQAIRLYSEINNKDGFAEARRLGNELLERLPPNGQFWIDVGLYCFRLSQRYSDWAGSNTVGHRLLKSDLPSQVARSLHSGMADNYSRLGQRANAVVSLKKARAIEDSQELHARLIQQMSAAKTAPSEMQPVVQEYEKKHADRRDRWEMVGRLASAYHAAGNTARARTLLEKVLPHESSNLASLFVRWTGKKPEELAACERVLLATLQKNTEDAAAIRYVLAFDLYRDRMKDLDKARAMARALLLESPTDDSISGNTLSWLLSNPASDKEFQANVRDLVVAARKNAHLSSFRGNLRNWAKNAKRNKDQRKRLKLVSAELAKLNDPVLKLWDRAVGNKEKALEARDRLLESKLSDEQVGMLLNAQAENIRRYGNTKSRVKSVPYARKLAKRFPDDYEAARLQVKTTTDYGTPEEAKAAVSHLLRFDPPYNDASIYRRVMLGAGKTEDKTVIQQAHDWIRKAQKKHGPTLLYAAEIGDVLDKNGLEKEALAFWMGRVYLDLNDSQSHSIAGRVAKRLDGNEKVAFFEKLAGADSVYHGAYASWLADEHLQADRLTEFASVLRECRDRQDERAFRSWGMSSSPALDWVSRFRGDEKADADARRMVFTAVKDLRHGSASATASLALLELAGPDNIPPMERLLSYQDSTTRVGTSSSSWDRLKPYAQAALARQDYAATATLATGMLTNITSVDSGRKKGAREMISRAYSRMGAVGLAIDENSPIAPLLGAALYLRLGDRRLARVAYMAHRGLFDKHRNEVPIDLFLFIAETHIAAGGDENHNRAEDILRGWIIQFSESEEVEGAIKARVQLLLAKNYFSNGRYEVARSEFTTLLNRYKETPQAIEAEFGIGETFMAQKVYDRAAEIFEKLGRSRDREVVIRAEFLRGVLASRRGDRDEARQIFRSVLERVPDVRLANRVLFNLAEVYGAEQRYMDQLELLNTVGRLGRRSKRWHVPGVLLSIVVLDSDLGISRGNAKIPVVVTTSPGGDEERVHLLSGGAGRGLFRTDVETRLGQVIAGDGVLQLTGKDTIRVDYPDEFKEQFRFVPLADVEIRIASDGKFEVSSSRIVEKKEETFSERLERESRETAGADKRKSQGRPRNQVKPGNQIYLEIQDTDRDLSDNPDELVVKLVASSGDQVQLSLVETGPHTGIFEGTCPTGELPAGALSSDNAIGHSPLMAIDQDRESFWQSEPDGATPKWLTIDMKDLRSVSRVSVWSQDASNRSPVRGRLEGSHDGRFWFTLASNPTRERVAGLGGDVQRMTRSVYLVTSAKFRSWKEVVDLTTSRQPVDTSEVETLGWQLEEGAEESTGPHAVVWRGWFVQPKSGAVRLQVNGVSTAIVVNGLPELALDDKGGTAGTVDVWLERGRHDLTIFATTDKPTQGLQVKRARENPNAEKVVLAPFRAEDFDLELLKTGADDTGDENATDIPVKAAPLFLHAGEAKVHRKTEAFGAHREFGVPQIGNWKSLEDWLEWDVKPAATGHYGVWVTFSHAGKGGSFRFELGEQMIESNVTDTGGREEFVTRQIGVLSLSAGTEQKLALRPVEIQGAGGLLDLRQVELRPTTRSVVIRDGEWEFRFGAMDLRYVKLVVDEYVGEAVAIHHIEVAGEGSDQLYIPTASDVLALAGNDTLEIAAGDVVTASYTDEFTTGGLQRNRVLTAELTATYFNGKILPLAYDFVRSGSGGVGTIRKSLLRVDPGERIVIEVVDYDMDQSAEQDKVAVQVVVNDGEPFDLTAVETAAYSGVFRTEVDTTTTESPEAGKLAVAKGDRVYLRYLDQQNTFPGHSAARESIVFVNKPTEGSIRIVETRYVRPPKDSKAQPQRVYLPPRRQNDRAQDARSAQEPEGVETYGIAYEVPLTVEVIDPDAAKDSRSSVTVHLKTTDGAEVRVKCVVTSAFDTSDSAPTDIENWALYQGRFVGQVILQLGGKDSPTLVPVTADMPKGLVGLPLLDEEEAKEVGVGIGVRRVLSLTGKDRVVATYEDVRRPDNEKKDLLSTGRLIADGTLAITDRDYKKEAELLHVGERLFLVVNDPDLDRSDERDTASVRITTSRGEDESVELEETLSHSGIFTGSFALKPQEKPTAGNHRAGGARAGAAEIETFFGDTITVTYTDKVASTESGDLVQTHAVQVAIGTDGLVSAFSKVFGNEKLAVETRFHVAESYFELFKSHNKIGRSPDARTDLEAGRRVLRDLMEDFPDPKYVPRVAYLRGQFAQELEAWDEAIDAYTSIVREYPDHTLAADAQYKLAQCNEEAGDFPEALEAYVTLAATYPKSPLIANVMIRINEHFYKDKNFEVAAQVCAKFLERFESHQWSSRMAFRIGQCHYKSERFEGAGEAFDRFAKLFPDDELCADALFWSGESFRMAKDVPQAFRRYNRCRWDFPASEASKYARGRLALPEMLAQFEREANLEDE